MAAILGDILKYLKVSKEINRDNVVFRVLTDASFGVFVLSAIIGGMSTYIGDPIVCQEKSAIIEAHCWLHGTRDLDGSLELEGQKCIDSNDQNKVKTLYYQWVVFMLVITGIIFKIPAWTWKMAENGLMETFYDKSHKSNKFLKQDPVSYRQAIEEQATIFKNLKKGGSWNCTIYYMKFLFCQLLAMLFLALNFHATDVFLNNKFAMYGSNVIEYYNLPELDRNQRINPMCNAFPTRVSCTFKKTGTGGGVSLDNDYCILAQNIINEKIYLILWFWFIAMFIFASFQFLLEICILALPFVRQFLTFQQVGSATFLTSKVKEYLKTCTVGEWFVLYQIGKNTHKDFFFKFLKHLAGDMEELELDLDEKSPLKHDADNDTLELKNIMTES